jgi:hypothetical protein
MNTDRLRPIFRYARPLTGAGTISGVAWRFDCGRPRREYWLVYHAQERVFLAGRARFNGHGTTQKRHLPKKFVALFRSMLPDDQLARAMALSLLPASV